MSSANISISERIGRWFGNPPKEGVDALPVRVHGREFARTGAAPGSVKGFDQPLIWVIAGLLLWGWVMVYSASIALNNEAPSNDVWHAQYLARHAFSLLVGFVFALLVFQVPMERWEKAAPWIFIVSIVLLIVVLLPFIGKSVNGARRWISFGGLNFQPSELAKLGTLLYAANYMVRKMDVKEKFFAAVTPMAVAIAIVGSLLLAEPDMGAFLVIAVIAMGMLFLGGVNARMFILITGILLIAFALMIAASPWRRERIFAYLDPFGASHALGKGFQLSHSLIAFGRGEVFGVGLGGSVEKLHWLPEAHTDFLLAVLGEEFG
ncbi:MAG: putative peptidoglycan glycosyltransferase FtsW, partial [Limnohabitans sp.]